MKSLLLAGLSASNECRKIVVELILVSGHQPVGRALAHLAQLEGNFRYFARGGASQINWLASIKDCAGSTACPASLAGNSPSPCANAAVEASNNDATEQSREIRVVSLLRLFCGARVTEH